MISKVCKPISRSLIKHFSFNEVVIDVKDGFCVKFCWRVSSIYKILPFDKYLIFVFKLFDWNNSIYFPRDHGLRCLFFFCLNTARNNKARSRKKNNKTRQLQKNSFPSTIKSALLFFNLNSNSARSESVVSHAGTAIW